MLDVSACERGRDVCGRKRTRESVLFAKLCALIHASWSVSFTIVEMDERWWETRFAREKEVDVGEEREMCGDEI